MRFGCCVNMLVPIDKGTGVEMVERVAAAGFDYLELPVVRFAAATGEVFDSIQKRVKATGLAVESCNDFFPADLKVVGPAANLTKLCNYATHALQRASQLGAKNVVFGSGPARTVPDGFPREAGFQQLIDLLLEVGPIADANDLTIAIEPLNRTECNIILNLADACELARRVAHPCIQVLADYYHFALEHENPIAVNLAGSSIRHVHFSNPQGRGFPRDADPNFAAFCRVLRGIGYDRRMSVEAFSKNFEDDAAATLKLMRELTQ